VKAERGFSRRDIYGKGWVVFFNSYLDLNMIAYTMPPY
jgi:hypothetical protein